MRALVAGASGLVGGACLAELLDSPRYAEVTALVRRPLPHHHPRLRQVRVDFDSPGEEVRSLRVDDVFCCLGTTLRKAGSRDAFRRVDYALPLRLAEETRAGGAEQFLLVSSLGADPRARTFYLRVKGELEHALAAVGFPTLVIARPSLLLGRRPEFRLGEALGAAVLRTVGPLLVGRWRKFRPIPARKVARVMIVMANAGKRGRTVLESDQLFRLADG